MRNTGPVQLIGTSQAITDLKAEVERVSLSDAEANVAALKARLASYENQYKQLRSSARLVPQVEAELAQLNRDYDVQKKTYSDLLARREAATMGVDVQDTGGTQFRVIDPPRVSPQPRHARCRRPAAASTWPRSRTAPPSRKALRSSSTTLRRVACPSR